VFSSSFAVCFSFIFFPFPLVFSLLFSLPSPLFSLSLGLSVSPFFLFSSPSLVFIGKNRGGRRGWGGHCAAAPPPPLQQVEIGLCRRLFEVIGGREVGAKQRRKENLLLPLFSACPGEEDGGAVFKTAPFLAFFFFFLVNSI